MFTNECLTGIEYEATTSAIVMAGLFLSFIIDFVTHRIANGRWTKLESASMQEDGLMNVLVLEAGILFHSICESCYPVRIFSVILMFPSDRYHLGRRRR